MRPIALVLVLVLVAPVGHAFAQSTPAAPPLELLANGIWPKQVDANGAVVDVYQPQVDKWEGNRLEARIAVAVHPPGVPQPQFGVLWITARTDVDKVAGLVLLEDVKVTKVNFPGVSADKAKQYLAVARQHAPPGVRTVPLAQLEACLAVAPAARPAGIPVNNDPPRIIVSATPALLVRIDGQPSLRQSPGSPLLRVINTRALILLDSANARYYLFARGQWMEAPTLDGPWNVTANPPASLEDARRAAVAAKEVDLLEAPAGAPPSASAPTIYVSSVPAELIETDGPPSWSPITGTELLYATNTSAHMFLELKSQTTFVLISGRWFRAQTTAGPWAYVPPAQLPGDFAKIPEASPAGVVLASVPGTPQAQEAVIANSIPQTATVNRADAHFTATYDGPAQFRPISSTPLAYAANSPTPIIRVDAKTYYSLYNGVWFVAVSPVGPWAVAAVVPAVIYTIPPSSPLHYVTYVRVYGATATVVYVGYTPGYLGTVVTPEGVVVYGTGVVYTPWVGSVWYPPPPTYGYGAAFAWGATTGFVMGAAVTSAAMWGCCGTTTTTNVNVNKTVYNGSNVYNNTWSKTTVSSGSESATAYRGPNSAVVTNNQNNNVYASHDGNVYKKDNGQWEKWNGSSSGWQPVNTSQTTTQTTQKSGSSTQSAPSSTGTSTSSSQNPGGQRQSGQSGQGTQTTQSPRGQSSQTGQSTQTPASAQRSPGESQSRGGGQGSGAQSTGSGGSRFGGQSGQGGSGFSQRRSGMQGLEGESEARDRGFARFSGARFGGFRR
jgi:hypothetical protein